MSSKSTYDFPLGSTVRHRQGAFEGNGTVIGYQGLRLVQVRWPSSDEDGGGWFPEDLVLLADPLPTPTPTVKKSPREELLLGAVEAVTKQRNNQYGPPTQDFDRTAALWTILFNTHQPGDTWETVPFTSSDVAIGMIALKLSRLTWDPKNKDSWMDIAGYAACGYETTLEEENGG